MMVAGDATIRRRFDSMSEFATACEGSSKVTTDKRASRQGSVDFTETDSFDQAEQLARFGGWDHDEFASLDGLVEGITERISEGGRLDTFNQLYSVSGSAVDMSSYCSGSPDHMITYLPEPSTGRGKVVRVVYNVTVAAGIDTGTMIRKGATVLALVEILAGMGFATEIIAVSANGGLGENTPYSVEVTVKGAAEQYDRDAILYAIAHPSMLRRSVFALMETESAALRKKLGVGMGYGTVVEVQKDVLADLAPDVLLKSGVKYDDRKAVDDPAGWVMDQLEGLNLIEAEEG